MKHYLQNIQNSAIQYSGRLAGYVFSAALLVLIAPVTVFAQLSGNYTIGSSPSADYTTISAAVTDMETNGINGPVWMEIEPGTYNEAVTIGSITGTSPNDTIVFDGVDSSLVSVVSSSTTFLLTGTERITLMNMTIESTSFSEHNEAIRIGFNTTPINFGDHINVWNNILIKDPGTVADLNAQVMRSYGEDHDIRNNVFIGGAGTSYLSWNTDDIHFHNNHVAQTARYGGIYLANSQRFYASGNVIENVVGTFGGWGIFSNDFDGFGAGYVEIVNNKILDQNSDGIYLIDVSSHIDTPSVIANNFISSGFETSASTTASIRLENVNNMQIIYNSVYHDADRALRASGSSGLEVFNNALSANNYAAYIEGDYVDSSDYNNFHGDIYYDGVTYTTLGGYQTATGLDPNSISGDPVYMDINTDLRVEDTLLYQAGTPHPDYETDVFGKPRDTVTPSIGAYEILEYDLEMVEFLEPADSLCGVINQDFYAVIRNIGVEELHNFDIILDMQGAFSHTDTFNYTDTLSGFSAPDTLLLSQFDTRPGGSVNITVYHTDTNDLNPLNDTLKVERDFLAKPDDPVTMENDTVCGPPGSVQMYAHAPQSDMVWFANASGGTEVFRGDTFQTPDLEQTTTYYVESEHQTSGCTSERFPITIVSLDLPEIALEQGDTFSGTWGDGTQDSPDLVCAENKLQYELAPQYTDNINIDSTWEINDVSLLDEQNNPAENYTFTPPDSQENALLEFTPSMNELGEFFTLTVATTHLISGCVDTTRRYIGIQAVPEAAVEADSVVCYGEEVTVYNQSAIADTQQVDYTIYFGDGQSVSASATDTVSHTYNQAGTYTITLEAISEAGCIDVATTSVLVNETALADFNMPDNVCIGDSVYFDNQTQVGNDTVYYDWDFGDGNHSQEFEPGHIYASTGTYTVELITETEHGCIDTVERSFDMRPLPVAEFEVDDVCLGEGAQFTNLTNEPDNDFNWDFGDGNSSGINSPMYLYDEEGTYTVTLTEITEYGCTDAYTDDITVNPVPEVDFEVEDLCLDEETDFTNLTSDPDHDFIWDFGNGDTSGAFEPDYMYDNPGTYWVTLTEINEFECSIEEMKQVEVFPSTEAYFETEDVCLGQETPFNNMSDEPGNSFTWDFGDGNSSNDMEPSHIYSDTGTYTVTLTEVNDDGCYSEYSTETTVHKVPEGSFGSESVCVGEEMPINNMSDNPDNTFIWSFGDGDSSDVMDPLHTYDEAGSYTIILVERTPFGCEASDTASVEVHPEPESGFTTDPAAGVTFEFIPDEPGQDAYFWDFDDGNTSEDESPVHTYDVYGTFVPSLTVTHESGCESTSSKELAVLGTSLSATGKSSFEVNVYPNPARSAFTISMNLHEYAEVGLSLYSYEGRKIADIAKSQTLSSGKHDFPVDGDAMGLSAGLYFIELNINGKSHFEAVSVTE